MGKGYLARLMNRERSRSARGTVSPQGVDQRHAAGRVESGGGLVKEQDGGEVDDVHAVDQEPLLTWQRNTPPRECVRAGHGVSAKNGRNSDFFSGGLAE